MVYRVLRVIARLALRWYYRSIEVHGLERIPATGAVILAANHNNALVDALLVASSIDREVRLTAKATLLDHPLTRVIVHAVGIVPLRRVTDEARITGRQPDASRNLGAFQAVVDTLSAEGMVLIFPEGRSHSEPELAPLKTGCARMAIQAIETGVRGLSIIPVGLTFEAKGRPRSRVVMHIGLPIPVDADITTRDEPAAALTAQLDAGLRDVTLNFPTHDDAEEVLHVSHVLSRALEDVRPLDAPSPPLADTVLLARRIERVRQQLATFPPSLAARVHAFLHDLDRWQLAARRLHAPLGDVGMSLSIASGGWFMLREGLIAVALGPVALWGRINHWLPLRAALALGAVTSKHPDEPAMHTLVGGLVLVLGMYGLIAGLIGRAAGWPWALGYLALLPAAASLDFWWADRVRAAVRRARGYLELRANPQEGVWLVRERERLRTEARALTRELPP